MSIQINLRAYLDPALAVFLAVSADRSLASAQDPNATNSHRIRSPGKDYNSTFSTNPIISKIGKKCRRITFVRDVV